MRKAGGAGAGASKEDEDRNKEKFPLLKGCSFSLRLSAQKEKSREEETSRENVAVSSVARLGILPSSVEERGERRGGKNNACHGDDYSFGAYQKEEVQISQVDDGHHLHNSYGKSIVDVSYRSLLGTERCRSATMIPSLHGIQYSSIVLRAEWIPTLRYAARCFLRVRHYIQSQLCLQCAQAQVQNYHRRRCNLS